VGQLTADDLRTLEALIMKLSPEQQTKLANLPKIRDQIGKWKPNPGPQKDAFTSQADELFFGGQAGGGKTELAIGLALLDHYKSLLLRRTNKEATKIVQRFIEILGSKDGWNGQDNVWNLPGRVIDISGVQHEDDKQKFKGTPHDLIAFDEISDFTESQYRFIIGWNRATKQGQRCRVLATGNPPTTPEGLWVLKYWAPWVDENHPNPAEDGELRWFTTVNDEDTEVDGVGPHYFHGEKVMARSRSFIRSKLEDNPDLSDTNYASVLAALPEGLRSAYKEGRFSAALKDDQFQVVPTAWILAAQSRWKPEGFKDFAMTAMSFDPAGGGNDAEELIWRHGGWYSEPNTAKWVQTSDGSRAAGIIVQHRREGAPVVVDVGGGYGGAVTQRLSDNQIQAVGFNGTNASSAKSVDGKLGFYNKRAEAWWRFREALNPDQEGGSVIALPPSAEMRADLAAPRWKLTPRGIQVEAKDEIRKRLGRSPGKGDVAVMGLTVGTEVISRSLSLAGRQLNRKPKVVLGYANTKRRH